MRFSGASESSPRLIVCREKSQAKVLSEKQIDKNNKQISGGAFSTAGMALYFPIRLTRRQPSQFTHIQSVRSATAAQPINHRTFFSEYYFSHMILILPIFDLNQLKIF